MDNPFDDALDSEAAEDDLAPGAAGAMDDADQGDGFDAEGFDDETALDGGDDDLGDSADLGDGTEALDGAEDDMALWNAFEEEVADGLDAADEDEFLGRLLGGLGRAGGMLGRAAGVAQGVARGARRFGQVAGQAGQLARRVSPAAASAARLARLLGAPGLAQGLGAVSRGARIGAQLARRSSSLAGGVGRGAAGIGQALGGLGQAAGGIGQAVDSGQALLAQLSRLIGGGGNEFDDFDALADLYEDGVDEALPGLVGLAARAAARGMGFRNVAQMGQAGRRALVRGVAAAARELVRSRDAGAVRTLPRLAHAAGRTATRSTPTPQAAVRTLRRGLPRTARRLARNPRALPPVPPRPLTRPRDLGRGLPSRTLDGPRSFRIDGPVTLSITPR